MIVPKIQRFNDNVLSKYQVYNSIFMTLPFDGIENTGALLPLFHKICQQGFSVGKNPSEIVNKFITKYLDNPTVEERNNLLFQFIQYIERQVVLFDAIEDATFTKIHNMKGIGTIRSTKERAFEAGKIHELQDFLKTFKIRPVLTAHPTQFYPGTVLAIITDLTKAIAAKDLIAIKNLLAQLGKTPFFNHKKPTPYDEAISLIWYLENVFYHTIGAIYNYIQTNVFEGEDIPNEIISLGFWPGGDRDGNPFVTTKITLKVAKRLRKTILSNYYTDLRNVKRRLTFKGITEILTKLEKQLLAAKKGKEVAGFTAVYLLAELKTVRNILIAKHQSLFIDVLDDLINKVSIFGFHFATLDIRQDSSIHNYVFKIIAQNLIENYILPTDYFDLDSTSQVILLSKVKGSIKPTIFEDEMTVRTLESIDAIKQIQAQNGEKGANRYIISNSKDALDVMQTFAMLNLSQFEKELTVDIAPLFETVIDLQNAASVMEELYLNANYRKHLKERGDKQMIMLGFSDGTKDGGYLMSNWGIYKAKEALTAVSRKYDIDVAFFDGRGGPPARGGGKTHQFYASLGKNIAANEIQVTIQGQTISSKFGMLASSQYNLEQLLSAGIYNAVFDTDSNTMNTANRAVFEKLAATSYQAYVAFKEHDKFIPYLEHISTLKYYAKANIGSRPSKRGKSKALNFSDLRAIPFVGSWSQLKQNVPGFYGVGTALEQFEVNGEFCKVEKLYKESKFFRVLLENSMMSLTKSFFELTAYMANDEEYGDFWQLIFEEYKRSKRLLLKLTGYSTLMQNDPATKASIKVRDEIVLPLLTIQQFALREIKKLANTDNKELIAIYEKMVTRSLFGNINASRNSA